MQALDQKKAEAEAMKQLKQAFSDTSQATRVSTTKT
jgi:hypothetical protein